MTKNYSIYEWILIPIISKSPRMKVILHKSLAWISMIFVILSLSPASVYAADNQQDFDAVKQRVNALQATDPSLPWSVTEQKGRVGTILSRLFDANGKIGNIFLKILGPSNDNEIMKWDASSGQMVGSNITDNGSIIWLGLPLDVDWIITTDKINVNWDFPFNGWGSMSVIRSNQSNQAIVTFTDSTSWNQRWAIGLTAWSNDFRVVANSNANLLLGSFWSQNIQLLPWSGWVGIWKSPTSALDVLWSGQFTGTVSGANPTAANNFTTKSYVDTALLWAWGGKFVDGTDSDDAVYTAGNVGIGTTSPATALDVNWNTRLNWWLAVVRSSITPIDLQPWDDSNVNWRIGTTSVAYGWGHLSIGKLSSSNPAIYVDYVTQNVGIGRNSATTPFKLDVAGDANFTWTVAGATPTSAGHLTTKWYVDGAITAGVSWAGDDLGNHTATENIQLNNNWLSNDGGNEGIRVSTNWNVWIGSLNASASPLYVDWIGATPLLLERSGSNNNTNIQFRNTWWSIFAWLTSAGWFGIGTSANISSSPLFYVDDGGNVGIWVTDPTDAKLEVDGNIISDYPTENNHVATKVYVDDAITVASNNDINALSDAKTTATSLYLGTDVWDVATGNNNTAIWQYSFQANTTWIYNTAVWSYTLNDNTTWNYNIANGWFSLYQNTTWVANIWIWYSSLYDNTTWSHNTGIWYVTLYGNTTWNYNVALWSFSLETNTTGNNNTALWYHNLRYNTTWSQNTAVWYAALDANTTAGNNAAVGYYALSANTTWAQNTAVWSISLDSVTTWGENTAIGYNALGWVTTWGLNIALGSRTWRNITTWNSNIIIGYWVDAPSATASNQLNIGNTIYGTLSSPKRIGIWDPTPTSTLDIQWNLRVWNAYNNVAAPTNGAIIEGNVGIWTTSAWAKLDVAWVIRSKHAPTSTEYIEMAHGGWNAYINWDGDGNLDFRRDGVDRLSLEQDGKLVANKLQINSNPATTTSDIDFTSNAVMSTENNMYFIADSNNDETAAAHVFAFNSEWTTWMAEAMRVNENGVVITWTASAANPTAATHLTTKSYVDSAISTGGADNLGNHIATTNLNMNTRSINFATPTWANLMNWTGWYMRKITNQWGFTMGSDSSVILHAGDQLGSLAPDLWITAATSAENMYLSADGFVEIISWRQSGLATANRFRFNSNGTSSFPWAITAPSFNGAVNGDNITDGTIDSSEIQDNTLTALDLAPNSVGNSELVDTPTFTNVTVTSAPTATTHATNKAYVDNLITQWVSWKAPVDTSAAATYGACDAAKEWWATYNKSDDIIYLCNASAWVNIGNSASVPYATTTTAGRVQLSGDIGGTWNNLQIQPNTVWATEVALNSLTAANLAVDSVGASEIATAAVWSAEIANNTITETDISDAFIARNSNLLDGVDGANFLRSNVDDTFLGKLSVWSTNSRRAGIYGVYDSTRIGHIWSMGTAYQIDNDGATFGNLYGLAYKHTNNPTGWTMAGSHQTVHVANWVPQAAMWFNGLWTNSSVVFGAWANQRLYGDNVSAIYLDSNNSSISQLIFRDLQDDQFGRVYGSQWDYFGLLDGDGHWAVQHFKDNHTMFAINNVEKARITNDWMTVAGTVIASTPTATNHLTTKAYVDSAVSASWWNYILIGSSWDQIQDATIDSSEIQDNTLTAADLAPNSVGNSELVDTPTFTNVTVTSAPTATTHAANKAYVDAAVTGAWSDTQDLSLVTSTDIISLVDGWSVDLTYLRDGDIITDGTVDSSEIQDNTLTAADLAANSVWNSELIDNPTVNTIYAPNWFRSTGSSGWYSETHGWGWHMSDTTWIRAYNGKAVYVANKVRADAWFDVDGTMVIGADAWIEWDRIRQNTIDSSEIQNESIVSADIDNGTLTYSDTNVNSIQRRVASSCSAGSSIRVINNDGTVVCETDDSGGTNSDTQDLSISGRTISLVNGWSVTVPSSNTDTQNLSLATSTDVLSLTNGWSVDFTYLRNGDTITDNTVDSSEIQDDTLTSNDLAANSVRNSELANDITVTTMRAWTFLYTSDKRLKTNFQPIKNTKSLLWLGTYRFDWKSDIDEAGEKREISDIGFIAQEVEEVFPEFVNTDEDGYKSVDYAKMVVPLLEETKRQQAEIDDLRSMIQALQNK